MRSNPREVARALVALGLLQLACAHGAKAPPMGDRDPDAEPDPDHPEVNCKLHHTIDCRPDTSGAM